VEVVIEPTDTDVSNIIGVNNVSNINNVMSLNFDSLLQESSVAATDVSIELD
jgi:hypothetical protein